MRIQVSYKYDKNNGYFKKDQLTFLNISFSVPLRMGHISNRSVEKIKINVSCSIFSENRALYGIMWKNTAVRKDHR
jgi:hypothetical protein